MNKKVILGIAAHPDDLEFSCGGSLSRWAEQGCEIFYAAFSPCKKSIPKEYHENILYQELGDSCKLLGLTSKEIFTYDIPVRDFPEYRQVILESMIELRKTIQPDLVLIPNSTDVHQDHHQVYLEGVRAFRKISILGYELLWNNQGVDLNYHVPITRDHLAKKNAMIQCYSTQQKRAYSSEEFIESWARTRGILCNAEFAESFELINWRYG